MRELALSEPWLPFRIIFVDGFPAQVMQHIIPVVQWWDSRRRTVFRLDIVLVELPLTRQRILVHQNGV